jgi:hypothetical protein
MKTYLVTYESKSNLFKGRLCIPASSLPDAQEKFWDWLKRKEVFNHLWKLEFDIEEIEACQ